MTKEKRKIRIQMLLLMTMLLICFAPVAEGSRAATTVQAAGKSVKLNKTKKTIYVGDTYTLKMKNTGKKTVKWAVANKKIATIKKSGSKCAVTGAKAGTTTVKAKVGGKTYKCKITVKDVSISSKAETLVEDGKCTLTLKYGGASTVKWSTNNSSVVNIKANGNQCKVTGINSGSATVKAKVNGKTYKCKITVIDPTPLRWVDIEVYQSVGCTIFKDITDIPVTVKSNDTSIVTVGEPKYYSNGTCHLTLKGVSPGTTDVIATAGGKDFTIEVTVDYSEEFKVYMKWRADLENQLWTSKMSALEKIETIGLYITDNFLYDDRYSDPTCYAKGRGGDCKAFSAFIADVATDLGLKFKYNGVTSSIIPGHRNTSVYIDGVEYVVDAYTYSNNVNTLSIVKK